MAQDTTGEIASQNTVAFIEKDDLGNCPLCGKPVIENRKAYGCSAWKEGCPFVIWKEVAPGQEDNPAQAKRLINGGRSGQIKGFNSRATGKSFDAYLAVRDGQIVFDFP